MTKATKLTILATAKRLFALYGYEGFSMRTLAQESGVGLSSIYHFFNDKDEVLREIFKNTSKELGIARAKLSAKSSAQQMLYDRIKFQFLHIEEVVFVLKFYLHFRPDFLRLTTGYVPKKAYLHIEEVLEVGVASGEFTIAASEVGKEAKVIAHAINGFLLEYYPDPPKGKKLAELCSSIHMFLLRSLTNKEVPMQ